MMTSTGLDCKFHRGALWTEINQQDRLSVWNASRVSRLRAMKAFMKSQGVLNAHWCVPRNAISFRVTPKMPFIGVGVTGLTMSIDVYCGHPNKFGKNLDCPSLDGRVDRETVIPWRTFPQLLPVPNSLAFGRACVKRQSTGEKEEFSRQQWRILGLNTSCPPLLEWNNAPPCMNSRRPSTQKGTGAFCHDGKMPHSKFHCPPKEEAFSSGTEAVSLNFSFHMCDWGSLSCNGFVLQTHTSIWEAFCYGMGALHLLNPT